MTDAGTDFGDDGVLVAALRRGDEHAFAWLLDRYSAPLCRLARSYVSTQAAADEVVQEAWLAVITGIDRFEQRSSLKTWLYRIVTNVARTRGVKDQRTVPFASFGAELDAVDPAVDPDRFQSARDRAPGHWAAPPAPWDEKPEEQLTSSETLAVVTSAIDALPPAQQTVIRLRDVEGWTSEDVCNALAISENNQRVLLHRARSKVRTALELHFTAASA